ncbi:unnamed protein product [Closterium sp. Yama58-4]|nr:unnamed protein product [Closterium sp. Yama58-4]
MATGGARTVPRANKSVLRRLKRPSSAPTPHIPPPLLPASPFAPGGGGAQGSSGGGNEGAAGGASELWDTVVAHKAALEAATKGRLEGPASCGGGAQGSSGGSHEGATGGAGARRDVSSLPPFLKLPFPRLLSPQAVVAQKAAAEVAMRGQLEGWRTEGRLNPPFINLPFPRLLSPQAVVAQKAAAEAAMRGHLEGLAAGVEGERAARESALDALMTDFESRVSASLPPTSSVRSPLATITSSATAAPTEPDSISTPSTLAPPHTPVLPPSSLPSSHTSSHRSSLPSSLSSSLTTFVSSSSEIEALAQRARAAALAAATAAAGRGGAGAASSGAGGVTGSAAGAADFAALPGISAGGGGDFSGMAEAGGMMAYPGGPHTSLIPTSSTGTGSAVTERSDGGGGGGWSLGLGLRWSGGRVQRRQRFVVDTAWLEGIRRDYMELQRQLAEEQQKNLVVQQLAAEKAWMEAALMRFLQMKRQHEEEVAQLMAKVARLEQAVASSGPSVAAAIAERTS